MEYINPHDRFIDLNPWADIKLIRYTPGIYAMGEEILSETSEEQEILAYPWRGWMALKGKLPVQFVLGKDSADNNWVFTISLQ